MKSIKLNLICVIMLFLFTLSSRSMALECDQPTTFAGAFDGEVTLCQNWDAGEQQQFWFLSQGSQIIPYKWFLALEQKGSSKLFRDPEHMDAFRYLPQRPTTPIEPNIPGNPDGLPIGFTLDKANGNEEYKAISDEWLGLTCAACHTGQIEFGGHKMLIDGAPTMGDFEGMMHALAGAMQETLNNPAKFDRFASSVLEAPDPAQKNQLRDQLTTMTKVRQDWNKLNAGDSPYGFARLDAIGAIFNAVAVTALGKPENRKSANAPVSYPFIWDTPQHDVVQWNGSVPNKGPGALGRNVGEVLGVFGSLKLDTSVFSFFFPKGHQSSVDIKNLGRLEALLWELQSPQWPETILPPIDQSKIEFGKTVYKDHCLECHKEIKRSDPNRRIEAVMNSVEEAGTDPGMAANFANRRYDTGGLFLSQKNYLFSFSVFGGQASGAELLTNAVAGTIVSGLLKNKKGTLKAINAGRDEKKPSLLQAKEVLIATLPDAETAIKSLKMFTQSDEEPVVLEYKARPLNGIWATAPYLHNGSVRNIRQLLLPPDQREKTFKVGSRKYDPKDIGFVNHGSFRFDTSLKGNSNLGHDYNNAELQANPEKLEALIEYLKTL